MHRSLFAENCLGELAPLYAVLQLWNMPSVAYADCQLLSWLTYFSESALWPHLHATFQRLAEIMLPRTVSPDAQEKEYWGQISRTCGLN
jgi:hypothetical protein